MTTELSTTHAQHINQLYAKCKGADDTIRDSVLDKINIAIECGHALCSAKAEVGHGTWQKWVRENLHFSEDKALIYMRFAKANPEPVRDLAAGMMCLKDALIASEALAAPSRAQRQQRSAHTWSDDVIGYTMKLLGVFNARFEKAPLDEWADADAERALVEIEKLDPVKEKLRARLGRV